MLHPTNGFVLTLLTLLTLLFPYFLAGGREEERTSRQCRVS